MPCLSTSVISQHSAKIESTTSNSVSHPLARHSFGWLDGVAVTPQPESHLELNSDTSVQNKNIQVPPRLSILIRKESDDPWMADMNRVEMYILQPDRTYNVLSTLDAYTTSSSSFSMELLTEDLERQELKDPTTEGTPRHAHVHIPYIFPPIATAHSTPTSRGLLRNRCTDIHLGPCGSALWVQPSLSRTYRHAYGDDQSSRFGSWSRWDYPTEMDMDVGLTAWDVHASRTQGPSLTRSIREDGDGKMRDGERLVGWLFDGRIRSSFVEEGRGDDGEREDVKVIWTSEREGPLNAVDYEEGAGRVVLGEGGGWVTVLDLVA